ncbi:hypothetical protein Q8814_12970, partial [Rhodococcus sp. CC-R104]|nr:hypothetical protein [Rhodococcus sp. CC-R104]
MTSPSLTLTVWAGSWLSGHASPDDVIDALHGWAPMHLVSASDPVVAGRTGLPDAGVTDGAAVVLATVRRADPSGAASLRLVLPAPGDVRGLPAGTPFAAAALAAGEGVLVGAPGTTGIGLVPVVEGPDVLRWAVFGVDEIPADDGVPGLGAVEYS